MLYVSTQIIQDILKYSINMILKEDFFINPFILRYFIIHFNNNNFFKYENNFTYLNI